LDQSITSTINSVPKQYLAYTPYNPIEKDNNSCQFINTVKENKKFYTMQQFERAKKAKELYHTLGNPLRDFKTFLHMNFIKINPIKLKGVKIAENIFGPKIGSFESKILQEKSLNLLSKIQSRFHQGYLNHIKMPFYVLKR
jgi:hypothetical protein